MANILDNTTSLQNLLNKANNLPNAGSDITLPELSNPALESDILSGKEAIDKDGNIIEGAIVTKTASNLTANGATVTVPAGYYATQVTKSVPTATQATPSISVDASGKITATATQTAGYVAAGSKSATKQLAFQPAKTITPTKSSQVAVSSGYYTGGAITVAAIPDTYIQPSGTLSITENGTHNVKNYASVNVSIAGGTGGNTDKEDALITRTFTTYENSRVASIGEYAFWSCSKLTTANFPKCTSIGEYAFNDCSNLTTISFPICTNIGSYAFYKCSKLTSVSLPKCTNIGNNAFYRCLNLKTVSVPKCTNISNGAFSNCTSLASVSLPACTYIGYYAFSNCYNLSSLTLENASVCTLATSNAFRSTPYAGYSASFSGTPYIYVPSSLVETYKSATNWTYFSSYFSAIKVQDGGSFGGCSGD